MALDLVWITLTVRGASFWGAEPGNLRTQEGFHATEPSDLSNLFEPVFIFFSKGTFLIENRIVATHVSCPKSNSNK